jgi:hypothetical protein
MDVPVVLIRAAQNLYGVLADRGTRYCCFQSTGTGIQIVFNYQHRAGWSWGGFIEDIKFQKYSSLEFDCGRLAPHKLGK